MEPKLKLLLTLEDQNTKNQVQTLVEVFEEYATEGALLRAVQDLGKQIGAIRGENMETKKAEEQTQDLAHHKTEETDTLVKAERPADDFMKSNDLDKETHGKAKENE
jgi:hypothetical protein